MGSCPAVARDVLAKRNHLQPREGGRLGKLERVGRTCAPGSARRGGRYDAGLPRAARARKTPDEAL